MKQFRDLSISVKLTLLAVVTSLLALLGTRVAFIVIDHRLMKSAMVERYSTMADVFGQNCLPSLEFSDAEDARSVLSSLHNDPHVCLASLYDEQDFPFASYARDSDNGTPHRLQREDAQGRFGEDGHLHLVRPIWRDQKLMGRLYLQIDLEEMRSR